MSRQIELDRNGAPKVRMTLSEQLEALLWQFASRAKQDEAAAYRLHQRLVGLASRVQDIRYSKRDRGCL